MRRLLIGWATLGPEWSLVQWDHMIARLPVVEAAAAARYASWRDRQRRVLGRQLLGAILDRVGLDSDLSALVYTSHGKPFLPGRGQFSITHAGEIVACAWTPQGRVGLDVETTRPGLELSDLKSVLTDKEYAQLKQCSTPLIAALKLWTMKEAITKATGLGIASGLLPEISECDGPVISFAGSLWYTRQMCRKHYALSCVLSDQSPWGATIFRLSSQNRSM